MKKKLTIISSTFVPNITNLEKLEEYYSFVETRGIGEWSSLSKTLDECAIIICLSDFVLLESDNTITLKRLDAFFNLLLKKINDSPKPTYFLLINDIDFGPVLMAGDKLNYWGVMQRLYFWMEKLSVSSNFYACEFCSEGLRSNEVITDIRNYYAARCRLSANGLRIIFDHLLILVSKVHKASAKVLVIDCDNTIWGGVVGEDGIDKLILGTDGQGSVYVDIQKEIKRHKENGILIAVCSKNEFNDVENVFKNHPNMIISLDDVVSFKVNWNEKYKNIQDLSTELGLGLESFVFLDDNPLEREKINAFCPDVKTINLPVATHLWPSLVRNHPFLNTLKVSASDIDKTSQYKVRAQFEAAKLESDNINQYLSSLNIKINSKSLTKYEIARASQLCLKTNQFNFTLHRYSEADLTEMLKLPEVYDMKLYGISDTFADHGIVAFSIVQRSDKFNFIKIFNMSCRVLGRKMESILLFHLHGHYNGELLIPFNNGDRNKIALDLLESIANNVSELHGLSYDRLYRLETTRLKKTIEGMRYELTVT